MGTNRVDRQRNLYIVETYLKNIPTLPIQVLENDELNKIF